MNKSYYAVIPADVRYDKRLTDGAKLLYGEITALCNQEGYCWATNQYFAKLYGVSKVTISKWVNQLIKQGYIHSKIKYKEGTKEIEHRYLSIVYDPIKEKFNTPIKEKFKDNTTSINNTSNNNNVLFNEWWSLYDLKRDKKKCESKYKTLLKKYSHEEMMEGTKNYINHLNNLKQRGEFVPQKRLPSTFLNNENFNDEYEQPKKAVNAEWADF